MPFDRILDFYNNVDITRRRRGSRSRSLVKRYSFAASTFARGVKASKIVFGNLMFA